MNYHIGRDGQQLGEFSEDAIRTGLREGRFLPTDLAWAEGMAGWQALGTLPQFQTSSAPFPPTPPAPSYGGQPQYGGQPAYGGGLPVTQMDVLPPANAPSGNGLAITSFVCGLVCCFGVTAIVAVVCGHMALSRMNRYPSAQNSRGLAVAGLILGYIGIAIWLYDIIMFGANWDQIQKSFQEGYQRAREQQMQQGH